MRIKTASFLLLLISLSSFAQGMLKDSSGTQNKLIFSSSDASNPTFFIVRDSAADYSNYFEGIITYMIRYESNDPAIRTVDLASANGTLAEFYFKAGNYLQKSNGRHKYSELFHRSENKFYEQASKGDTIKWIDCSKKNEVLIGADLSENSTEIILDHTCKSLKMETNDFSGQKFRTGYYFFSNDLKIDPKWFEKCKYRSANRMYSKTKSIPLKIIYVRNNFKVIMTAIGLEKKKLDDSVFELDKSSIFAQLKSE